METIKTLTFLFGDRCITARRLYDGSNLHSLPSRIYASKPLCNMKLCNQDGAVIGLECARMVMPYGNVNMLVDYC